jgi:hypothetical protein
VAGQDQALFPTFDPVFGWLREGSASDVFYEYFFFDFGGKGEIQPQGNGGNGNFIDRVPGDGLGSPSLVHPYGFNSLEDVRQSADGSLLMVRYEDNSSKGERLIDVVDVATATPVSQNLIPNSGGPFDFEMASPRFKTLSDDLYLLDEGLQNVVAYQPDGTGPTTIFSLSSLELLGEIRDFVLAPDDDTFAAIVRVQLAAAPGPAGNPTVDRVYMGTLTLGSAGSVTLGSPADYEEMIFHPDGQRVYIHSFSFNVRQVVLEAGVVSFGETPQVFSTSDLDIHADNGNVLMRIPDNFDARAGVILPGGVYVTGPDLTNPVLVTPKLAPSSARWLRTTRSTPGITSVRVR